jgi:uncharacterized protein (TIGR02145 family)
MSTQRVHILAILTGLLMITIGCQKEPISLVYEDGSDAPTALSARYDATQTFITITWEDNSTNESGFELERSVGTESGFEPLAELPAESTSFVDASVTFGTDYFYRIRVKKAGTTTPFTKSVKLSPPIEYVRDIDGNIYIASRIGNQTWMGSNLRTTRYADGTPIADGSGQGALDSRGSDSYWFAYDNDTANKASYGLLYTWDAMTRGSLPSNGSPSGVQGACPDGWHIPSNAEWDELISGLGGLVVAGGKMKSSGTSFWGPVNEGGTNASGFNGLPAGFRLSDGRFVLKGSNALYWTASAQWQYGLEYVSPQVNRAVASGRTAGLSVRCVKNQ